MPVPWKKSLALLSGAQAISQSVSVFIMTLSSIAGAFLSTDSRMVTIPVAAVILGTLLGLFPSAAWMAVKGRRSGFRIGTAFGLLGALIVVLGLSQRNIWVFAAGHLFIGFQQGAFQYLRFAAGETVPITHKSKGISLVLAGGVIAAFLGPWIAHWSRSQGLETLWGLAYGPLLILYSFMILIFVFLPELSSQGPHPLNGTTKRPPRKLRFIITQLPYLQALLGSVVGYAIMILLMTATPLSMGHSGHSSADTSWVIQWHVLGMFVPSFFTGSLIKKFGHRPILLLGILALGADALTVLLLPGLWGYWLSLTLLGIGWNFLYIASTSRLTGTYRPEEKEKAQAFHDVVVFTINVAATYAAAHLLKVLGWETLHLGMIPMVIISGAFILWPRKKNLL